jgi:hypothetical protein
VARTFYRASPYAALPFWRARMWGDDPAGEAAAEARFEAGQARRADLSAAVRREGGQALRLAAAPGLSLAPRPVIRGGLVVSAPCAVFEGRVVELPDVEPQVLLPLIDDRPMAAVFDAYAAAVGQAPSVVLGRRIMGALLALADPGALTTRVAAPPGPGR